MEPAARGRAPPPGRGCQGRRPAWPRPAFRGRGLWVHEAPTLVSASDLGLTWDGTEKHPVVSLPFVTPVSCIASGNGTYTFVKLPHAHAQREPEGKGVSLTGLLLCVFRLERKSFRSGEDSGRCSEAAWAPGAASRVGTVGLVAAQRTHLR